MGDALIITGARTGIKREAEPEHAPERRTRHRGAGELRHVCVPGLVGGV